jgi:hypothetical protein
LLACIQPKKFINPNFDAGQYTHPLKRKNQVETI